MTEGREGKKYKKKRIEYKKLCEMKKREESERWEKRAAEVKREKGRMRNSEQGNKGKLRDKRGD